MPPRDSYFVSHLLLRGMQGAIWSEDTMSAETSAALRAAALGWVDRHEFDHPDLEFFAQRRSSTQAAELR